ncbi:MAG: penicillin-binding transpeptidase domain-containing protein [Nitrolancea sp.]
MSGFVRAAAFVAGTAVLAYGLIATKNLGASAWLIVLAIGTVLLTVAIWPRIPRTAETLDRTVIRGTSLFLVGFLVLGVQLARIQVVDSSQISARSASASGDLVVQDPRKRLAAAEIIRGSILTSDGQVVAQTTKNADGSFARSYPDPATAYLAGYYSPLLYGSSNLESAYDSELMGTKGGNPITQWLDGVLHREKRGYNLQLTINDELQKRATELLGDQRGAVVLMDATTGAVVAMASTPNFDPNKLYVNSGANSVQQTEAAKQYWAQLNSEGNSPLLLRPTQGLYIPGSIFKTVTASTALQSGIAQPDTVYRDEGALTVESRVIPEENRPDNNRIDYTLTEAYGWSLNVVFAQVGLQVGADRLAQFAQQFGLGSDVPFDLPVATSKLETDADFLASQAALAVTAFGQGQLQVTPLQMALITDAVVNGGNIMTPYMVDKITDQSGNTLSSTSASVWRRAIESSTADQMEQMMISSVQNGYASPAQIPGYVVGGKTGTAEVGGDKQPNAWFIGFAGKDKPQYVVAVVVENGGEGGKVALPIGQQMLQAAVKQNP